MLPAPAASNAASRADAAIARLMFIPVLSIQMNPASSAGPRGMARRVPAHLGTIIGGRCPIRYHPFVSAAAGYNQAMRPAAGVAAKRGEGPGMRVLVLQHISCEPPGAYEEVLVERGASIHRVEIDEGQPLPDRRDVDAIVAMGGPMSVNDDAALPWLRQAKQLIG